MGRMVGVGVLVGVAVSVAVGEAVGRSVGAEVGVDVGVSAGEAVRIGNTVPVGEGVGVFCTVVCLMRLASAITIAASKRARPSPPFAESAARKASRSPAFCPAANRFVMR